MLSVRNIEKSFFKGQRELCILHGANLEARAGESIAIVGASGVGKSTFLQCLGLLDEVDQGEILLDSQVISSGSPQARTRLRRENIGFVFQFHYLMAELTALENVFVPFLIDRKPNLDQCRYWLDRVGLSERLDHRPSELSGGEQQRVAVARALVRKPRLILADEPTGNLDPTTAKGVFEVLKEQCRELGTVLVMATHNLELAAELDRTLHLKEGVLI